MVLYEYTYIFAIGTIFAFLDAWNIGANDVANSWATSVASRSLTLMQAMIGASIMEFSGCMGVGARVADTIRTKIIDPELFAGNPGMLMLGMTTAVIASSIWLSLATWLGFPVSTTHSIMGGVIGMGVAMVGAENVTWVPGPDVTGTDIINTGVVAVFMAWVIAPGLAGIFAATIFTITKYAVMLRKNPVYNAFICIPIYFSITAMLLAMLLIWKGGSYDVTLTPGGMAGAIIGTGVGFGALTALFLMPWLWRVVVKDDWQLRWYHIPQGPFLLRRGEVPAPPADFQGAIRNFYEGHMTRDQLDARRAEAAQTITDPEAGENTTTEKKVLDAMLASTPSESGTDNNQSEQPASKSLIGPKPEGKPFYSPEMLFWFLKKGLLNGVDQDIHKLQHKKTMLAPDLEEIHAHSAHYDNKAEFMYSFLQIMTACTASFTHGANDVSNAIGPYTTIYQIWHQGRIPEEPGVPNWILAFGGVGLVIGLWTYGYHIMAQLGNKLTLQSPSRGFSMELGATCAIILATRLSLPVSTTQCITGAIVGVGLCNGEWRALNWRMIGWIYAGWIFTLPCAGIISGCLTGIIINAPRWPGVGNA